jgi:capsular exopolysaccharide synthesis family protein
MTIETLKQGEPLVEAYGFLLTSVLLGNNGKPPTIVAVTGAQPSDGVSTTAFNLAVVMARTGRPVALVDANMRSPVLHTVLGLPRSPGLADLLTGRAELKQVILPTRMPHLMLVPAGETDAPAQALLSQSSLADAFALLRSRFDLVVIDTAPLLQYPDALHVGKHVDGVLQVVSARSASRRDQQEARRLLQMTGVHFLGAVMNQVPPRTNGRGGRAW